MHGYRKFFMFIFALVFYLFLTSCEHGQDSMMQFVKNANWLGEDKGDIYLLHKRNSTQAKSFEEVFSSYERFKKVSWQKFKELSNNKEYIIVEARGLIYDADGMVKAINDISNQDADWVLKSLQVIPANARVDQQLMKKVLNEIQNRKLSYIVVSQFLIEMNKKRARLLYLGGALVDQEGNIVHKETIMKNYNITIEKSNFYRNIEYTSYKTALAEMILLEHGHSF